jgi:cytoskeletal protein RodZ
VLVARYLAERSAAPAIASDSTISDVRRRRRAGGIPLGTIARDTGIPISLLRELEWGIYDNWLLPHAEPSVIAYADRAGLDPNSVLLVLAREQHQLQPSLPVHVRRIGLSDRTRGFGLESRHRTAPYALAAGLLAMLAFATPSDPTRSGRLTPDTSVSARSAEVRTISLETQQAAATPDEQEVMSAAEPESERAADAERPRKRRKARVLPANDEAVVGETGDDGRPAPGLMPQTRLRPRTPPRTALARFAHAIAGDGTYRVEPFPRPADH